jgi:AcrR family transcriptional regulator
LNQRLLRFTFSDLIDSTLCLRPFVAQRLQKNERSFYKYRMTPASTSGKGAATRDMIVERAYMIASSAGLEGLSIGPLADAVGMSKSGVFAHFGSREDLQLAVLDLAAQRFGEHTLIPALKSRRGLPRLHAIFDHWLSWLSADRGGCLLLSAVSEYDDRPGPLRDRVLSHHQRWRSDLVRAIGLAVSSGEFRSDVDAEQLAFEFNAIALSVQHDLALTTPEIAIARGRRMFERLLLSELASNAASP